jgi:hypothetical protein
MRRSETGSRSADFDRPRRGLIEVSQESLIDVKQFVGPLDQ